ncbi:hypothetical protein ILUMI_19480 [Ignelater luminosus]|uniref:Uncharacterized protein n=1 Tax=Ignelater luminosus TaxID=2038154 RepID=A0A8K0G5U7_IGNLU|nr:hypothetical protein ILUMI_19480 [Ignelater luminosus]
MWQISVSFLILCFSLNNSYDITVPSRVVFYDQPNYEGKSVDAVCSLTGCCDITPELAGRVGSYQLKTGCAKFYEEFKCDGRFSLIRNSSESVLYPLRKISSFRSCMWWL